MTPCSTRSYSGSTPGTGTRVYDPRRVLAGTLTSALTWGVFGLLTGGVASGGLWAIIGAVCGGLFAYYTEHLLTKDELRRIGQRLPADSSAITAFVRTDDARRVLASAAPASPRKPAWRRSARTCPPGSWPAPPCR